MTNILNYVITDPSELNLSYITFVNEGGLFVPTKEPHVLGDIIEVDLTLPKKPEAIKIEGKVIWITPPNALYHSLPGIGVQFIGKNAKSIRGIIEGHLNPSMELGGYTCGITETRKNVKTI